MNSDNMAEVVVPSYIHVDDAALVVAGALIRTNGDDVAVAVTSFI